MMEYCVFEDGIITNIIVCENDNIAAEFGAHSIYDGAVIGEKYRPPESAPEPTQLDRIEAQAAYTAMMTDTLLTEVQA